MVSFRNRKVIQRIAMLNYKRIPNIWTGRCWSSSSLYPFTGGCGQCNEGHAVSIQMQIWLVSWKFLVSIVDSSLFGMNTVQWLSKRWQHVSNQQQTSHEKHCSCSHQIGHERWFLPGYCTWAWYALVSFENRINQQGRTSIFRGMGSHDSGFSLSICQLVRHHTCPQQSGLYAPWTQHDAALLMGPRTHEEEQKHTKTKRGCGRPSTSNCGLDMFAHVYTIILWICSGMYRNYRFQDSILEGGQQPIRFDSRRI